MAVKFNLYDLNELELIITFPVVFESNFPINEKKTIEHENVRGKGSIIVDGGEAASDLYLKGVITGEDYDDLIEKINNMEDKVQFNVPYVLKIESSSASSGINEPSYHVKRKDKIEWQSNSLRTNFVEYTIIFRTNSW